MCGLRKNKSDFLPQSAVITLMKRAASSSFTTKQGKR